MKIKKLNSTDIDEFKQLILLFEGVFEIENFQMPEETHLRLLLNEDSFGVFVALSDNKVIGGLTSYVLQQYYTKSPLVYLYDLAVKKEFQRKGIGKMLISALKSHCKEIGVAEIFVQADEVDVHAIDFYHSTGGMPANVVQFTYILKS